MNYEKSCGCVVFRKKEEIEFLLILNQKFVSDAHWGFPKGHVEEAETEEETACRELLEETGIRMRRFGDFRYAVHYSPRPGVEKDAVYFLSEYGGEEILVQEEEVAEYRWCSYEKAQELFCHDTDKNLLTAAYQAIR